MNRDCHARGGGGRGYPLPSAPTSPFPPFLAPPSPICVAAGTVGPMVYPPREAGYPRAPRGVRGLLAFLLSPHSTLRTFPLPSEPMAARRDSVDASAPVSTHRASLGSSLNPPAKARTGGWGRLSLRALLSCMFLLKFACRWGKQWRRCFLCVAAARGRHAILVARALADEAGSPRDRARHFPRPSVWFSPLP